MQHLPTLPRRLVPKRAVDSFRHSDGAKNEPHTVPTCFFAAQAPLGATAAAALIEDLTEALAG